MTKKAICLISGGLDSCVSAATARDMGFDLLGLHICYGQKTMNREKKSFFDLLNHFEIKEYKIVKVPHFSDFGGSALLNNSNMIIDKEMVKEGQVPDTYVPFRNGNILSIAISWAEIIQADAIFIGLTSGDGIVYPDCTSEFVDAFQKVIDIGTKMAGKLKVMAPLIDLKKSQIVEKGLSLNAPFELTWSCYKDQEKACGECISCISRLEGFKSANLRDPIPYKTL